MSNEEKNRMEPVDRSSLKRELDEHVAGLFAQEKENFSTEVAALVERWKEVLASASGKADEVTAANTSAQTLLGEIQKALDTTNSNRDVVASVAGRAEELNDQISTLSEKVRDHGSALEKYETEWKDRFEKLHGRIESLLPGATSAGLARSFHDEKDVIQKRQQLSQRYFAFFLVVLAISLLLTPLRALFGESGDGLVGGTAFLNKFLWNLPVVAPALWGAWWFSRRATLLDRLAEEYRHKEVVASSFEGFKKQLSEGDPEGQTDGFKEDTIKEIMRRPGCVFEGKQLPNTPIEENLEPIVDALRKGLQGPD